jgi:hypothetical protein
MSRFSRSVVVDTDSVDLKVNDEPANMKVEEVKVDEIKKVHEVPPNSIYGHNLKSISSYNKLRKGYKLSNQKSIFLTDIKTILKEFPHDKHQYDDELLVEILNIAEQYFIYGNKDDREKAKEECIKEILLPYFRDDVELLAKTITHVWHKVKKTNVFKRCWSRFKNFFLKH